MAACICFALALVAIAFEVSDPWLAAEEGDTLRLAGSSFLVAIPVAIVLIGSPVYIFSELRKSPSVICGHTVTKIKKLELAPPYDDIGVAIRLIEGPRWKINVNRACRLSSNGTSTDDLHGEQEVRLTRKLYRTLEEDELVVLLCTAGGKGFKRLPHWPSWAHDASTPLRNERTA